MEYLVAKGYRLTITSLKCGHSYLTASGNVSAHSYGTAVDIAAVNGIPITGHQGPGTITEAVIKDLLLLQGTMRPAQIISLMDLGPPTFIHARPLRPHPRRLHLHHGSGSSIKQLGADPQARAVAAADRAPRRDPEPEGAGEAVGRSAARQGRQYRRLTHHESGCADAHPRIYAQALDHPSQPSSSSSWRAGSDCRRAATWFARDDAERVLIVQELDARRRRSRRGRRRRAGPSSRASPSRCP